MISPIFRWLGALAGLGSAILCWFLGSVLASPLRTGQLLHLGRTRYELIAFLFVPALILAALAFFWVPPQNERTSDAMRARLLLILVFLVAFFAGFARQ